MAPPNSTRNLWHVACLYVDVEYYVSSLSWENTKKKWRKKKKKNDRKWKTKTKTTAKYDGTSQSKQIIKTKQNWQKTHTAIRRGKCTQELRRETCNSNKNKAKTGGVIQQQQRDGLVRCHIHESHCATSQPASRYLTIPQQLWSHTQKIRCDGW